MNIKRLKHDKRPEKQEYMWIAAIFFLASILRQNLVYVFSKFSRKSQNKAFFMLETGKVDEDVKFRQ